MIVFVAPRGAWAASAGTFITLAGHVAAMAPGSTIGAAHPVSLGGENPTPEPSEADGTGKPTRRATRDYMDEKIENFTTAFIEAIAQERKRNVEWAADAVRNSVAISAKEALKKKVIDLIAEDLDDLLEKIDGRKVTVGRREVELRTKDARVVRDPDELHEPRVRGARRSRRSWGSCSCSAIARASTSSSRTRGSCCRARSARCV